MRWQGTKLSILETSSIFQQVLTRLKATRGIDIVKGFDETAFGSSVKKDSNYITLTTSTPEDSKTGEVADIMLDQIATVMERQLVDHLIGRRQVQ